MHFSRLLLSETDGLQGLDGWLKEPSNNHKPEVTIALSYFKNVVLPHIAFLIVFR